MCNQCNVSNDERVHAVRTRREVLKAGAALLATPFFGGVTSIVPTAEAANTPVPDDRPVHAQAGTVRGTAAEWLSYGGDKTSSKYSPLAQIGGANFNRLSVAWTWRSVEEDVAEANDLKTWAWESTPLMVGDVLYVSTSLSQVAALDAATGKTLWVYDPETWKNGTPSNNGFVHRGVAYWAEGKDRRILFGTGDGYLICLNAQTGKPILTFGHEGRIDLTQGLGRNVDRHLYGVSSPPIICRGVAVMGSKVNDVPLVAEMPPGDVRGFDVRTGKQQWIFHSVPRDGEFGNETWNDEQRNKVYYYSVFPNLFLSLHPDYMMTHTLWPRAADRTAIVCEWHFHPDEMAKPDFEANDAIEFWDATNREDWAISELSQAGIESRAYQPGPYSRCESLPHAFDQMVLDREKQGLKKQLR